MKNKNKNTCSKGLESLETRGLAWCVERLKEAAGDRSTWKSILIYLLLEDDSKGFGSFEKGNLVRCCKTFKSTTEDRSDENL